jgi:DMSO/TMAO reductase YedYZ molybdopterin-dependent catalytic subunit
MRATRGFTGRRRHETEAQDRVPPGQFVTSDFPVLTAGPTPQTAVADWSLALQHGGELLGKWSWDAFNALPQTEVTVDIHCVTKWSKLGTIWEGVAIDDLLAAAGLQEPPAPYLMAHCDGGYRVSLVFD